MTRPILAGGWMAALAAIAATALASYIEDSSVPPEREPPGAIIRPMPRPIPPPPGQVPELARYLDRLEIRRAIAYGRLAVFPVTMRGGGPLGGGWLTMDAAFNRGVLTVSEKEGGSVPVIWMENRSARDHILIVAGEIVAGGKQTRTVRQDVILAPGQRVDVSVFCVEAHRWEGKATFAPSPVMVPQSIQNDMRAGAGQAEVWSGVARSNEAAGARSATGNVEAGYAAPAVRGELDAARRAIVPAVPRDAVGFIFVERFGRPMPMRGADYPAAENPSADNPSASAPSSGRAMMPVRVGGRVLGAEFFGSSELALSLLSKIIDAYAVDVVVRDRGDRVDGGIPDDAAQEFLNRIRRAESYRGDTPGSGSGVRIRSAGLVGDGVISGGDLVHFACQSAGRIIVEPPPRPIPMPRPIPPRPTPRPMDDF